MDHSLGEHLTAKGQDDEIKSSHSWNKEKLDVAERNKEKLDVAERGKRELTFHMAQILLPGNSPYCF